VDGATGEQRRALYGAPKEHELTETGSESRRGVEAGSERAVRPATQSYGTRPFYVLRLDVTPTNRKTQRLGSPNLLWGGGFMLRVAVVYLVVMGVLWTLGDPTLLLLGTLTVIGGTIYGLVLKRLRRSSQPISILPKGAPAGAFLQTRRSA
jgi:hypothetical protein